MKMKDVITKKTKTDLAAAQNVDFLSRWAVVNEKTFTECMTMLASELPQRYVEIYLKVLQTVSSLQKNLTEKNNNNINADTVNVTVNKLDTLENIKDRSWRNTEQNNGVSYEEVK